MFLGTLTGSKNERETKKRHGVFLPRRHSIILIQTVLYTADSINRKILESNLSETPPIVSTSLVQRKKDCRLNFNAGLFVYVRVFIYRGRDI